MNKAILLMNLTSCIGGVEKRYINLFNYISSQRDDYYLILNGSLFLETKNNNILSTNENVNILEFEKKENKHTKQLLVSPAKSNHSKNVHSTKKRLKGLRKNIWLFRKFLVWCNFARQFKRIMHENKIGLIYSVWLGGIWVWPLRKLFRFKLIHSYNDSSLSSLSKSIYRIFDSEYWVLKHCDKIDFLSAGIIPRLEQKIGSIPNNKNLISPNSFIIYDNYYPEYPKEKSVVFISRLTSIKNPMLFMEAIKLYNEKYLINNTDFYILGIGPYEKSILEYIEKNHLTNVHFEGVVYKPWEYLRRSKIFISLQRDNNYPSQSLLEAMACENAIIASDVGETRKLVTENEGVLVNFNAYEIAEGIKELLQNEEMRLEMGKNARKKAITEHNIEKYSEYFYKITSEEENI